MDPGVQFGATSPMEPMELLLVAHWRCRGCGDALMPPGHGDPPLQAGTPLLSRSKMLFPPILRGAGDPPHSSATTSSTGCLRSHCHPPRPPRG